MDATPFHDLRCDGYDVAVIYDYTDEELDVTPLQRYREIVILAWSMGVFEALRFLLRWPLPVSLKIAVNGTLTPVDDSRGIPVSIFRGTLATLSETSLSKFNRRMCGSVRAYAEFMSRAPRRSFDSVKAELAALYGRSRAAGGDLPDSSIWDVAVISTDDMIFPASAQRLAWQSTAIIELSEAHLPDFQKIVDRLMVDKRKVARRFASTRPGYDREATLQHSVGDKLVRHLVGLCGTRPFASAVELGAGSGLLTRLYTPLLHIENLELWDIAPVVMPDLPPHTSIVIDDAEARLPSIPDCTLDLVISSSTLQWFNSPVTALGEIVRVLKPGGVAALSLYVKGTYRTLASRLGVSLNYADPGRLQSVLKGVRVLLAETEEDIVSFPTTRQLLGHLRATGVNAVGNPPASSLRRVLRENSLTRLEYNTFYLIFTRL